MDTKPTSRIRDRDALRRFALEHVGEPCFICERRPGSEVHHLTFRSQGGGDVPENLGWFCTCCHRDLHDGRIDRHTFE